MLAPGTLAALPSTRAIETRSLPNSLAAAHRGFAFYVAFPKAPFLDRDVFYLGNPFPRLKLARCPLSLAPTLVALPSISVIPFLNSCVPAFLIRSFPCVPAFLIKSSPGSDKPAPAFLISFLQKTKKPPRHSCARRLLVNF